MTDPLVPTALISDLRALIDGARQRVATSVNQALVLLHWNIGARIHREQLGGQRAEYGKQIVATLAPQLTAAYGRGFSRASLHRMVQFATVFPDLEIVSTLSRELGWSHFSEILLVRDPLARDFYAGMCRVVEASGIRVAEYLTALPPRALLESKLQAAIEHAQHRLADTKGH